MLGTPYNTKKPYKKLSECHECGERLQKHETLSSGAVVKLEIYDDPWAEKPSTVKIHTENDDGHGSCLEKLTDTSWADFRYFVCEECSRLVARQCGYNGWRLYVKIVGDEEICVACYHRIRLAGGEPRETFENGRLSGDFYSEADMANYGYKEHLSYSNYHITGEKSANLVCKEALALIDKGAQVLINYDSMGIGGGEGYVTLWIKEAA